MRFIKGVCIDSHVQFHYFYLSCINEAWPFSFLLIMRTIMLPLSVSRELWLHALIFVVSQMRLPSTGAPEILYALISFIKPFGFVRSLGTCSNEYLLTTHRIRVFFIYILVCCSRSRTQHLFDLLCVAHRHFLIMRQRFELTVASLLSNLSVLWV